MRGLIHAPVPGPETPQETPGTAEESLLETPALCLFAWLHVLIELEKEPVARLSCTVKLPLFNCQQLSN